MSGIVSDGFEYLDELIERCNEMVTHENNNELFAALAKAQAEFKPAKFDSTNPHFKSKYASLASVVDSVRAALAKNNLCVVQAPELTDTGLRVTTTVAHSSGQFMSSVLELPTAQRTPQAVGSVITYARRYALSSMLGVVADEDDDGNTASDSGGGGYTGGNPQWAGDAQKKTAEKQVEKYKKPAPDFLRAAVSDLRAVGADPVQLENAAKEAGLSGARDLTAEKTAELVAKIKAALT